MTASEYDPYFIYTGREAALFKARDPEIKRAMGGTFDTIWKTDDEVGSACLYSVQALAFGRMEVHFGSFYREPIHLRNFR